MNRRVPTMAELTATKWGTVGFLLYPGFEVLDVFGPLEMVGMLVEGGQAAELVTVAPAAGAVRSSQGPEVIAQHSLEDCPPLEVLFVPGGIGARAEVKNARLLSWLAQQAGAVRHLVSVCTGERGREKAGMRWVLRFQLKNGVSLFTGEEV